VAAIRPCIIDELQAIGAVINDAARAYQGVVPARFLHEPYMSEDELALEMASVRFYGYEEEGSLVAVMGIEPVADVTLLRHAYVLTSRQRRGIGAMLLRHMESETRTPWLLLGTWQDSWAVAFYRSHRFEFQPDKDALLARYWPRVGADQAANSVVLGKFVGGK